VALGDDVNAFKARLRGLEEVPPVATEASGSFSATLSSDGTTLSYTVTYKERPTLLWTKRERRGHAETS
jgi:hypothetical protein